MTDKEMINAWLKHRKPTQGKSSYGNFDTTTITRVDVTAEYKQMRSKAIMLKRLNSEDTWK